MLTDLILTAELVPSPCWGQSLCNLLPKAAWEDLRSWTLAEQRGQCAICGYHGRTLHCHEVWSYDDTAHVQKLERLVGLCPLCHHVKHFGRATRLYEKREITREQLNEIVQHFMTLNRVSWDEAEEYFRAQMILWYERSQHPWTTDFGEYADLIQSPDTKISKENKHKCTC